MSQGGEKQKYYGEIDTADPAVPRARALVTPGLEGERPPKAASLALAVVETWPALLPVALAPPVPKALNGAPLVPGNWPVAALFAPSEATGLPELARDAVAEPLPLNAAVPLPLAERLPCDVERPPSVVVPWLKPIAALELFAAIEPAVPRPSTAPLTALFEATDIGPAPIGAVALPLTALLPVALYEATAFWVALTCPRLVERLLVPCEPIAAVESDAAMPFDAPLPLPVSAPLTPLCAIEESDEPMAAVAVPPELNDPVAVSLPVVWPVTPPRLIETLFTPLGVLTATDTSSECAVTEPFPVPATDPATFELAVADSDPLVAVAVPLDPKEAVLPPVAAACPLEIEPATAAWPPTDVPNE
ncbi:MAG: hypothetical protein M0002_01475 [Rhodospirillales bacterium]|nr:hypothetical protein [Rhodospirillales bacterium]